MSTAEAIRRAWTSWSGSIEGFVRHLDRQGLRHLSYSKVAAVEFCEQRYLMEWLERRRIRPEPIYLLKGRLFHEAAARLHRANRQNRRIGLPQLCAPARKRLDDPDYRHVQNAVRLMLDRPRDGWEVVDVEHLFAMYLGDGLPPCVGVIDLILRRGDDYAVVDHKTCKTVSEQDELQLVIYCQYVKQQFQARRCHAHFDMYRWVNNLRRIRKPAFERVSPSLRARDWAAALRRIRNAHARMKRVERTHRASGSNKCFMCPFKDQCPKATSSYPGW